MRIVGIHPQIARITQIADGRPAPGPPQQAFCPFHLRHRRNLRITPQTARPFLRYLRLLLFISDVCLTEGSKGSEGAAYPLLLRRIPTLAKANITIVAGLPAEVVGHKVLSQRAATSCQDQAANQEQPTGGGLRNLGNTKPETSAVIHGSATAAIRGVQV